MECRIEPQVRARLLDRASEEGPDLKLTAEQRAFVGVEVSRRRDTSDGWRSPIARLIDQLGAGISPEDVYMLERLAGMDTPRQERLEFLG